MGIYYLIWGITSLAAFVEVSIFCRQKSYSDVLRNAILGGLWFLFTLLVCFKGEVGTDYLSYQQMFEEASNGNDSFVEPLFMLWIKFCALFTSSFSVFWMITSFFNILMKFYIMRNLSPFVSVSVLVYLVGLFFERDFDGIRQGLSIGICYYACIMYLRGSRWYKYMGIILCATFIHYTALLFFLIPFWGYIRLNKTLVYLLLLAGFVIAFSGFDILQSFFDIAGYDNFVYGRLYSYLKSEDYSGSVGINVGLIFRIFILLLFMQLKHLIDLPERKYNLLLNGFFFAIFISLIFNNFEILSHRLAYGYREFQIFIIPYLILAFKGLKNKMLVTAVISCYSLILLHRLLTTPHLTEYYFYRTFFS